MSSKSIILNKIYWICKDYQRHFFQFEDILIQFTVEKLPSPDTLTLKKFAISDSCI